MWNYSEFEKVLGKLVSSEVSEVLKRNPDGRIYNINEFLKGRKVALDLKGYTLSKAVFLGQIVSGAIDIGDQLDKLKAYEVYTEDYSYAAKKLTRPQHLRYTIENYLNDVFVLKNRIKEYLKKLKLLYSRDPNNLELRKVCERQLRVFPKKYERIIVLRGIHVHKTRYSEPEIENLERVEFISKNFDGGAQKSIQALFEIESRKQFAKWNRIIKDTNLLIEKDIDQLCKDICPVLLTRTKKIKYPRFRDMIEIDDMYA